MKIYILSDLEGTAGVTTWEQALGKGPEYKHACQLMTEEINAAADGAFAAGAEKVLVNDCHGSEENLDLDILDPRIEYLTGPGKDAWTGLDDSFDGLFQIGAHTKAGTPQANLRHTWDANCWAGLRINGEILGEIGLLAAGAGELGVPFVLVSGDDKACAEAAQLVPSIVQAQVKKGVAWQEADSLKPKAAQDVIRDAAKKACESLRDIEPFTIKGDSFEIEAFLIAEPKFDYYASSLEMDALLSQATHVHRARANSVRQAFLDAVYTPPVSL